MTDKNQKRHLLALGARVLSEANDLKRTVGALSDELNYDLSEIQAVIDGVAGLDKARQVIQSMSEAYPISLSDLWVEPDDTDAGVLIMRADQSKQSSRIFQRPRADGNKSDYYDYRDTAMSNASPFKPEWIQPIRIVDTPDPDHGDVAYNKGHLMHQMTFFIGEVNFYWRYGGKNYCSEMNTGDSNYITPFVPHSFTSRNPEELGLIVAVTFAGQVRRALGEFSEIGAEAANALAGNILDANKAFKNRLDRYLAAETMTPADLEQRLEGRGIELRRAKGICAGEFIPEQSELECIASALSVRIEDLLVTPLQAGTEVQVLQVKDRMSRTYPEGNKFTYRLNELVRFSHLPGLKGFDFEIPPHSDPNLGSIQHGLHEYIYNYGENDVTITWNNGKTAILSNGDSAHIRPTVTHSFTSDGGSNGKDGKLLVVRVPGALNDSVLNEFAIFSADGRHRVAGENQQWF